MIREYSNKLESKSELEFYFYPLYLTPMTDVFNCYPNLTGFTFCINKIVLECYKGKDLHIS